MKYGLNKTTLVGNVGDDPKIFEKDGEVVNATFSLATKEFFRDKEGKDSEHTSWHRVKVWNKQASIIKQYVKKGDPLLVEGRISYDSYEKEGQKHYITEIVCEHFLFLSQQKKSA